MRRNRYKLLIQANPDIVYSRCQLTQKMGESHCVSTDLLHYLVAEASIHFRPRWLVGRLIGD